LYITFTFISITHHALFFAFQSKLDSGIHRNDNYYFILTTPPVIPNLIRNPEKTQIPHPILVI